VSIKTKTLGTQNQTPRPKIWGINAKITDTLKPSLVTQYCVSITGIIKHDVTTTYWEMEIQLNVSLNLEIDGG
jgi:hypothetical protein